jgi:hypothetical protein
VQTYSRAARENDFEKLLVQINDSIGVLSDKLEKVHRSVITFSVRSGSGSIILCRLFLAEHLSHSPIFI